MSKNHNDDFKILAPIYEKFIQPRKLNPWMEFIVHKRPQKLLDVGGGTGRITQNFKGIVPKLFLADSSLPMLKAAKKKHLFSETCCMVEKLPYASGSFDCIVMVDAFHHVVNQKEALDEIIRILSDEGFFILEEPDIKHFQVKIIALFEKITGMRSHFFRVEDILDMLKQRNIKVETHYDSINFFMIFEKIVSN